MHNIHIFILNFFSGFIFASLIEFACVSYIYNLDKQTKKVKKIKTLIKHPLVKIIKKMKMKKIIGTKTFDNKNLAKRIDKRCRLYFPLGFFVFNLFYWLFTASQRTEIAIF